MGNRAKEYPPQVFCPLASREIDAGQCLEIQDCADGCICERVLEKVFKPDEWRKACQSCKYHEVD